MKALRYVLFVIVGFLFFYAVGMVLVTKINFHGRPLMYSFADYLAPNGGDTYRKSLEWESDKEVDFIVLGASRAERSYDPKILDSLGVHCFNLGSSAQSMVNSELIFNAIISKCKCKGVLLDIVPASFKDGALESTSDLIQNWNNSDLAYQCAWQSKDFRSLNLVVKRWLTSNELQSSKKGQYQERGYVSVHEGPSEKLIQTFTNHVPYIGTKFKVGEESLAAFKRIVSRCKELNIPCWVVISPVSPTYSQLEHRLLLDQVLPIVTSEDAILLDYSAIEELAQWEFFYDEKHMNASGVRSYNHRLLHDLKVN
jgi:hypothetical protein